MGTFSVSRTIRLPWDTNGYDTIARDILGVRYTLSLVLVGDTKARELNLQYRNKDTAANVLTFPLDKNSGEIFINIRGVKREAHLFDLTPSEHARFLLIHGCLHLKGYTHGSTMEKAEELFLKRHVLR
jgi:probable rRNA maturation factor